MRHALLPAVATLSLVDNALAQTAGAPAPVASAPATAAWIAAGASFLGACIAAGIALFNERQRRANDRKLNAANAALQQQLATLKRDNDLELAKISAELKAQNDLHLAAFNKASDERLSALAARRQYEYDARKRLYQDCEPLLFQLAQNARAAIGQIISLARLAREGGLDGPESPLCCELDDTTNRGYYFRSTLYRLLAPLVICYILQTRLTSRDISLDPWISRQFFLSEAAYKAFTRDFFFAEQAPVIAGYRETADRDDVPDGFGKHHKQGVFLGRLDTAIHCLVNREPGMAQVITFGEFEQLLLTKNSDLAKAIEPFVSVFTGFHPFTRPATWRILVALYCVFRAIRFDRREGLEKGERDNTTEEIKLDPKTESELRCKDPSDDAVKAIFGIGHAYMARALGPRGSSSWTT